MRIYTFVFLVSNAAPTRATGLPGESDHLTMEDISTASAPLFIHDPNNTRVNRLFNSRVAMDDEERAPGLNLPKISTVLEGAQKTARFKLKGGASKNEITFNALHRLSGKNGKQLKLVKVGSRESAQEEMDRLDDVVRKMETRKFREGSDTAIVDLKIWNSAYSIKMVVAVLKRRNFFRHICFQKVRALEQCFGENEAGLFETLSEGFGGMASFTSFLSIAKRSPIVGDFAEYLQKKLLQFWRNSEVPVDDVLNLLYLTKRGWRYETLDTLVEYVAVLSEVKPIEAYRETIELLKKKYSKPVIMRMIPEGKGAAVESATLHQRDGKVSKQTDLANDLKKALFESYEVGVGPTHR
uniref:RxLR effector candidate protein n=1 Tax=Peronospora matthiolae TaxID=2874970 RepID=A0AAV1TS84_9STRA